MKKIDLNCDMGELKSDQKKNFDAAIMPFISSCNVACGFHSGTPLLIEKTIQSAVAHQVKIGAHPSYHDRKNFGRLSLKVHPSVLIAEWRYQIGAIKSMVESFGERLHHVKPHGALYNDMVGDKNLATAFVQLVKEIDPTLKIFTLAHSQVVDICKKNGLPFVHEGFADRRYEKLDQLRSRSLEGAVIHQPEEVLKQIESFLNGKIQLWNGEKKEIKVDSICLHSDTEGAVELSQKIFNYLKENNVEIVAMV